MSASRQHTRRPRHSLSSLLNPASVLIGRRGPTPRIFPPRRSGASLTSQSKHRTRPVATPLSDTPATACMAVDNDNSKFMQLFCTLDSPPPDPKERLQSLQGQDCNMTAALHTGYALFSTSLRQPPQAHLTLCRVVPNGIVEPNEHDDCQAWWRLTAEERDKWALLEARLHAAHVEEGSVRSEPCEGSDSGFEASGEEDSELDFDMDDDRQAGSSSRASPGRALRGAISKVPYAEHDASGSATIVDENCPDYPDADPSYWPESLVASNVASASHVTTPTRGRPRVQQEQAQGSANESSSSSANSTATLASLSLSDLQGDDYDPQKEGGDATGVRACDAGCAFSGASGAWNWSMLNAPDPGIESARSQSTSYLLLRTLHPGNVEIDSDNTAGYEDSIGSALPRNPPSAETSEPSSPQHSLRKDTASVHAIVAVDTPTTVPTTLATPLEEREKSPLPIANFTLPNFVDIHWHRRHPPPQMFRV